MKEVKAYQVGTLVFFTIQDAQAYELRTLLTDGTAPTDERGDVADYIVKHTDEVVAILTCAPKPKPPRKPRSDMGTKRQPKVAGQPVIAAP